MKGFRKYLKKKYVFSKTLFLEIIRIRFAKITCKKIVPKPTFQLFLSKKLYLTRGLTHIGMMPILTK